jgi:hypothetical protein
MHFSCLSTSSISQPLTNTSFQFLIIVESTPSVVLIQRLILQYSLCIETGKWCVRVAWPVKGVTFVAMVYNTYTYNIYNSIHYSIYT